MEDKSTTSVSSPKKTKRRDETIQAVIDTVDAELDDESEIGSDEESE